MRRLLGWLASFEDGQILRAAFFGMLIGTIYIVATDYLEMAAHDRIARPAATSTLPDTPDLPDLPDLPAFNPAGKPNAHPGPKVTTDRAKLEAPLAIVLGAGGRLTLTGTIDVGAIERFKAEVDAHGEYVKTVVLDSPGGSLEDALAIGKLVRQKGYATEVPAGQLCASSCPLIFAGGTARVATAASAIGVHQFYMTGRDATKLATNAGAQAAALASSQAQRTTAEISRYLSDMGVDPALWLHALDTPPGQLYYLSAIELTSLKLVTNLKN
jgi:hypothetical protein